jgi:hypothetical protein
VTRDHRDQVILDGMWQTIKTLHNALVSTAPTVEWFFDVTPQEHRLKAAERVDTFNKLLRSADELVAPMRKIMEGN